MVSDSVVASAIAELIGTALLIFLGNGVVANTVLKKTYGENSGLLVVAIGWAMAAFIALFVSIPYSGGHLNPVVTLALAAYGSFDWGAVIPFICCQMIGSALGSVLVFLFYREHFYETFSEEAKLASFCTIPSIPNFFASFFSEVGATFVLVFVMLRVGPPSAALGHLSAFPFCLLILGIGLSLGGTTGGALNPARDLAPRIMHSILPIPGKGSSNWSYAWVPVLGPLIGAAIAVAFIKMI